MCSPLELLWEVTVVLGSSPLSEYDTDSSVAAPLPLAAVTTTVPLGALSAYPGYASIVAVHSANGVGAGAVPVDGHAPITPHPDRLPSAVCTIIVRPFAASRATPAPTVKLPADAPASLAVPYLFSLHGSDAVA